MSFASNWNYPTPIKFGPGRIRELAQHCLANGIKRPLLVTDSGLAKLPLVIDAVAANNAAGVPTAVFSDVKPNPVGQNVEEGARMFREGGHDGVIAFGGGSALDAGKAIAFYARQTRPLWDFEDVGDNFLRADVAAIAPSIAVPTTSGTGSEVGRVSVITEAATHTKRLIFHPKILPVTVIADPELTFGVPAKITAATGMDALAHCLEAYCAPGFHPMADGIALEGMRLIKTWLPKATQDGTHLEARANMMVAATMGAAAFQKGLGVIHSLAHPLGAIYDAHHGLLNGILMPYAIDFNRSVLGERMRLLAAHLDLEQRDTDGVIGWVTALRKELGIPDTLGAIGIDGARADEIAAAAMADPSTPSNSIPLELGAVKMLFLKAVG